MDWLSASSLQRGMKVMASSLTNCQSAEKVLEEDELVRRFGSFTRTYACFKETSANLFMHLGEIDAQRFAHGRHSFVPLGLCSLVNDEVVALVLSRGFQVAIAFGPCTLMAFIKQCVLEFQTILDMVS